MFARVRTFLYQDIFPVVQPPNPIFSTFGPENVSGETVIQTTYIVYQSNFNVVNQQAAPAFQPVPFMESPVQLKKPSPSLVQWNGRILQAPFVFRWGEFSESPTELKKPTPSLVPWADYPFLPIRLIPLTFSESPTHITPSKALLPWADISFFQIAYTPSSWGAFSESLWQLKQPKALLPWNDISFLQIAYTPNFFPWSESAPLFKKPITSEQSGFVFTPAAAVAATGVFSATPYLTLEPFVTGEEFNITQPSAAVTTTGVFGSMPFIAREPVVFGEEFNVNQTPTTARTTPGPLVFSESPWEFKQPIRFEQQGFRFTPAAFTAFPWSESPILLKKPIRFEQQGFRFTPAAFTISFSESPILLKRQKALLPWNDISFLQIAYTPSRWGMFSESPTRTRPPKALLQWNDISFLQIAYTPNFFPWSESAPLFKKPIRIEQPGFVFTPTAVVTTGVFGSMPFVTREPVVLGEEFNVNQPPAAVTTVTTGVFGGMPFMTFEAFVTGEEFNINQFFPSVAPTPTVPKARIRHIIKDPWCEAEFIPMWLLTDGEPMDD